MSRTTRQALVALAGALVAVVVFAVYSPWSARTFIRDDHVLVDDESASYREAPLKALFLERFWPESAALESKAPYYRPLVLASFRVDQALGGTPTEFHFTNVLLHTVATLLVAACAMRLGAPGAAAVAASLLFGLAPRLTESVAWISGRTDVLATCFVLGAIALSPDAPVRKRSARSAFGDLTLSVLSGALLFGALLSKEVAVAAVPSLLALAWLRRREAPGGAALAAVRLGLGIAVPALGWATLRGTVLAGSHLVEGRELGGWGRVATVFEAIGRYAEMILLPLWPRTVMGVVGVPDLRRVAVGGVVMLLLVALMTSFLRGRGVRVRRPGVVASLVLAAFAIAPVLHVVPLAAGGNVVCDRFLYVPLAALAMAAAVASSGMRTRRAVPALVAAAMAAVVFGVATRARAHDYEDEIRFWVVAVENGDRASVGPLNALGSFVADAGYVDLGCRVIHEGLARAERTGQGRAPSVRRTYEGYARCLAMAGRYDEAVRAGEELVAHFPRSGRGWLVLGLARLHVEDLRGAEEAFRRAPKVEAGLAPAARPLLGATRAAQARKVAIDAGRVAGDEARLEYLVGVGRVHDAAALAFDVVRREDEPRELRAKALRLLVESGDVEDARRAVEQVPASPALVAVLVRRERLHARVTALVPRLERLATP